MQGVSGMPCIAATAASPGRGAQPDAGVDAALGSAFNTSGRSNDDVCQRSGDMEAGGVRLDPMEPEPETEAETKGVHKRGKYGRNKVQPVNTSAGPAGHAASGQHETEGLVGVDTDAIGQGETARDQTTCGNIWRQEFGWGRNWIYKKTAPIDNPDDLRLQSGPAPSLKDTKAHNKYLYALNRLLKTDDTRRVYGHNIDNKVPASTVCGLRVPLLNPERGYRATWDLLSLIILSYVACVGPLHFGFDSAKGFGLGKAAEAFVDYFFFMDIFLNFFTSFHRSDGKLVPNLFGWRGVAWHYAHTWFPVDVIASLSLVLRWFDDGDDNFELARIARLFRLAKLLRFTRVFKVFKRWEWLEESLMDNLHIVSSVVEVFKALGGTALFAHLLACVWHRAGSGWEDDGIFFGRHSNATMVRSHPGVYYLLVELQKHV
jgi:hypothetical protein